MEKLILKVAYKQSRFFAFFFIVVLLLISWSYIEGVGDIRGDLIILSPPFKNTIKMFKAGYFTSLNYGIYYLIVMPFFLRTVFETYKTAYKITNIKHDASLSDDDINAKKKLTEYTSKIVAFIKLKYSWMILVSLIFLFSWQGGLVEFNNLNKTPIGWSLGWSLKEQFKEKTLAYKADSIKQINEIIALQHQIIINKNDSASLKALESKLNVSLKMQRGKDKLKSSIFFTDRPFYFKKDNELSGSLIRVDSVRLDNLSFSSERIPSHFEFILFVFCAKLFFILFESFTFF